MNSKKGYKYRLKLSENMLLQTSSIYTALRFPTYKDAYDFVCTKWGSEVLRTPLGLKIQEAKIGTDEWKDCR